MNDDELNDELNDELEEGQGPLGISVKQMLEGVAPFYSDGLGFPNGQARHFKRALMISPEAAALFDQEKAWAKETGELKLELSRIAVKDGDDEETKAKKQERLIEIANRFIEIEEAQPEHVMRLFPELVREWDLFTDEKLTERVPVTYQTCYDLFRHETHKLLAVLKDRFNVGPKGATTTTSSSG